MADCVVGLDVGTIGGNLLKNIVKSMPKKCETDPFIGVFASNVKCKFKTNA